MSRIASVLLALLLMTGVGHAANCPVAEVADFQASIEWLEPELIQDQASAALPASQRRGQSFPGANRRKLGSTESSLHVRTNLVVSELAADRGCYALSRLVVNIVAGPVRIFVARELDPDSCPYRVTLAHEQKHVDVFREAAENLLAELENDMRVPSMRQSIPAETIQVAVERFRQAINVLVGDARRRVDQEATRRNGELDTRSAYRAEQEKCPMQDWRIPFE
ncbi:MULTISPECIES: hypothetical protein [unclassified Minwuia]|jgi:hypothetical protein|uniref:hypothetical protein n=1 Tax=unclassified Minwuia TaxID=2618799 RepID=UPI00247A10DE|nr:MULTISPECIES: hypothetical protein [unclassified Minwuia]